VTSKLHVPESQFLRTTQCTHRQLLWTSYVGGTRVATFSFKLFFNFSIFSEIYYYLLFLCTYQLCPGRNGAGTLHFLIFAWWM
jgi:hypothetical protein